MELPGEKLIIKLWDTLADKGVGSLLKPMQIGREGRATIEVRRLELLVLAGAEGDAAAIRRGEKILLSNGEVVDSPRAMNTTATLQELTLQPLAISYVQDVVERNNREEGVRKEINIAKAISHAEEVLSSDAENASEAKVSDDWFYRWRDNAANVSAENLQYLWGRVLAGEVKVPGQYTLRALEFLKNLSEAEAEIIERISSFVVSNVVLTNRQKVREANEVGANFSDMLLGQELGLFAGVDGLGLQMNWKSNITTSYEKVLLCRGKMLMIKDADPNKVLTLEVCVATALGRQILQLSNAQCDVPSLKAMGLVIKEKGFEVEFGTCNRINDQEIQFIDAVKL
jgi:Protein of unknown function (DUF2806)